VYIIPYSPLPLRGIRPFEKVFKRRGKKGMERRKRKNYYEEVKREIGKSCRKHFWNLSN